MDSQAAFGAAVRGVSEQLTDAGAPEPYVLAERIMHALVRAGWRLAPALAETRLKRGQSGDPASNPAWREGRERARLAREAAERAERAGVDQ